MLVCGRASAICGVFVPKPNFERMWRISHKQPLKRQCRKSANKQSAITTARFINAIVVCRKCRAYRNGLVLLLFAGQCCLMFWKTETVHVCLVLCCTWNKTYLFVEYCKKCNFGQKTKRENEKKHKHRQKTIQVSNFHNAAETDVNLTGRKTGRKQVLIQKSRRLFFDGKTAQYLRK